MKKAKIPAFAGMTILFFLLFGFFLNITFSQDTTKTQPKPKTDTAAYKPFHFILSEIKYSYINQVNPDTVTRKRFLWYPTKTFEDVFNYLPGYYLNYMDVGQFNPVSYDQLPFYNTAFLRNGRPINDLLNGSVDFDLFSRNEIAEIEQTNGFGNIINYDYQNAVSFIQRQIFQNRAYTEISFIQDRYENIYVDGNFHQNLFRRLNLNFGATKHTYDGKYKNSDFDKWLGRFNLNFAASERLNFFAYVNYARIQKGLNEGIIPDTVNLGNKSEVFDPELAVVRNADSYEKKERFDIDAGAVFTIGKSSYSKVQLFESNSFRQYRDEENRLNSNGFFFAKNKHWINYGVKLQQIFNFRVAKKVDVILKGEGEYDNVYIGQNTNWADTGYINNFEYKQFSFFSDALLSYKNINLEGYVKGYSDEGFDYIVYTSGIKANYTIQFDSSKSLNFFGQFQSRDNYFSAGFKLKYGLNSLSADVYQYDDIRAVFNNFPPFDITHEDIKLNGINIKTNLRIYKFDIDIKFSTNFNLNDGAVFIFPKHNGNADVSFHDVAFRSKLEYKVGLTAKGWSGYKAFEYDGLNNSFRQVIVGRYDNVIIPQNATLDFYIMGKIGRATFGVTFENILDRVIYNTGVYPMIDRGGLLNVISRFNLTWNFFD